MTTGGDIGMRDGTRLTQRQDALVEPILNALGMVGSEADNQRIQSSFRGQILEAWGISEGARILEIGCGQGDMTAMLAAIVGADGHVTAIDSAGPDYGAPISLGEATARIANSVLGQSVDFHFGCDLRASRDLGIFDYVVLSHSSWYFSSRERLIETLAAARRHAPTLCVSEWNPEPEESSQYGHALAVQILAGIAAFDPNYGGNISTLLSQTMMSRIIEEAGWNLVDVVTLRDSGLQDGGWEVAQALATTDQELATIASVSSSFANLLKTQIDMLRAWSARHPRVAALNSYALRAQSSLVGRSAP